MAKGWESKSVEDQIQETDNESNHESNHDNRRKQLTPDQMDAHRRREVLLLSRARVEKDLNASQNPRYRDQLTRALADLDMQISKLPEGE
jgi:hypothetical protein